MPPAATDAAARISPPAVAGSAWAASTVDPITPPTVVGDRPIVVAKGDAADSVAAGEEEGAAAIVEPPPTAPGEAATPVAPLTPVEPDTAEPVAVEALPPTAAVAAGPVTVEPRAGVEPTIPIDPPMVVPVEPPRVPVTVVPVEAPMVVPVEPPRVPVTVVPVEPPMVVPVGAAEGAGDGGPGRAADGGAGRRRRGCR